MAREGGEFLAVSGVPNDAGLVPADGSKKFSFWVPGNSAQGVGVAREGGEFLAVSGVPNDAGIVPAGGG